jgi:4-amino-4-deoxy-L-arabinose transferase-like glycosyltransferase
VLAIASNLLFERLGESSFHDGDEALYATVAREMVENHSYLTPTYWGTPFLHKPPLPYWLMAISEAVLPGSREFAARFPSAVSALLLLVLVYASTRRLAGAVAALFATCLLAINHQFLFEHAARSASFDTLLALLMFGALVAGLKVGEGPMTVAAVALLGWSHPSRRRWFSGRRLSRTTGRATALARAPGPSPAWR